MEDKIKELKKIINEANYLVFFGGAGVSTESGLKDFRSVDGLYNESYEYPPEEILSHTFFMNNPEFFYKFYKDKLNSLNYKPNITHYKLQELEASHKLKAIITQNIDGFHEMVGSKKTLELHGSILRNYCLKCHKFYSAEEVFKSREAPKCSCGGIIKPDVVLYEEPLNTEILEKAIKEISMADTLIVGGTSLTVYPASGLLRFFQGKNLVLINKDETPYDNLANLVIHEKIGEVFQKIMED